MAIRLAVFPARDAGRLSQYGASVWKGLAIYFKDSMPRLILTFFLVVGAQNLQGSEGGPALTVLPGAARFELYLPSLRYARVAVVAHAASTVTEGGQQIHLVDALQSKGIRVVKVFAPEHGFRSTASAGESVPNGRDPQTKLPIVSLYGNHKMPSEADLHDVDIVVFDLQDVGARFYTYISTLSYVMQSCAEHQKPLIVLDRPNPNGTRIDGPLLDTSKSKSFVGLHPVPVLYGMTIGEYGQMVQGEGWIPKADQLRMTVIPCRHYQRQQVILPVPPSPNLTSPAAIFLYPSLCFFEGTPVSVGRGTDRPFEWVGAPWVPRGKSYFIPRAKVGAAEPLYEKDTCFGENLQKIEMGYRMPLDLSILIRYFALFEAQIQKDAENTLARQAYKARKKKREFELRKALQQDSNTFFQYNAAYDTLLSAHDTIGLPLDTSIPSGLNEPEKWTETDSTRFFPTPRISKSTKARGFFWPFFSRLAGTPALRISIEKGMSEQEIRAQWHRGLVDFKQKRRKYLLYPDVLVETSYESYTPLKSRK